MVEEDEDDADWCMSSEKEKEINEEDEEFDRDESMSKNPCKRPRFSSRDKEKVLDFIRKPGTKIAEAVREINETWPGFHSVTRQHVHYWLNPKEPKPMGRPVDAAFEKAVLDNLISKALTPEGTTVNVAYSRAIIVAAARRVQEEARFAGNRLVQSLDFSDGWVTGFLQRHDLHRRRISGVERMNYPTKEEVQKVLDDIRAFFVSNDLTPDDIINADETGIFYGAQPLYQYVGAKEKRAAAPESDEKARFTAMVCASADGIVYPTFYIVKCTVQDTTDYTSSRVLNAFLTDNTFNPATVVQGQQRRPWMKREWQRELRLPVKKDVWVTKTYKRSYLLNVDTGDVITVQNNAWNDTVGTAMWFDVVLGPAAEKRKRPFLLIWDNCGCHTVPALQEVCINRPFPIYAMRLPPNMTALLQVMDLVVNGPLKAAIRRARCEQLIDHFRTWKAARAAELQKPPAMQQLPPFSPPKPTQIQGIKTTIDALGTLACRDSFKCALRRTFITACQAPDPTHGFRRYPGHEEMKKLTRGDGAASTPFSIIMDQVAGLSFAERGAEEELSALSI